MQRCPIAGAWWQSLNTPRPYAFALLILAGIILEVIVHVWFGIAVVYTHFFYLIIVIAGLWYGRKAVLIAIVFGAMHTADTYLITGIISPDALIRTCMFVIVALIVGLTKEQSDEYRDQLVTRNRELEEANNQLESSKSAFETANKKLNLLSGITRHDIRNQLLALLGFLGLSRMKATDPELIGYIEREEAAALTIQRQIEFTKSYEEIGVRAPQWQDVQALALAMQERATRDGITVSVRTGEIEIYADPLLEKVFENLVDNSIRHGERVRNIAFSTLPYGLDYLAIVYEDDGIGIHNEDKERIFDKGFGKNTGLGLFLSREILSITGISIKESGEYGRGARFEILIPKGRYRIPRPSESVK
ncbi:MULTISPECIES: HAMP domain-containing sensor histidine kinase [unclassified Methanoregula]|uniref:sensor histidine kinase n=1 Tax=unclassified Methanoregula TaxID=2649730 RepID=UPI0009CCB748|nr:MULTISPECIES: HAMP domain-containing sensor histidine kinase [unclassified Methanoregula]OPX64580.1 MAG: sensory histidine kinase AtoS [Methanoregula sp. PtaB.Bin085]OPY33333.1 MAG: sensory histidine kinase AtoS [Methanoregula sp. PtaU1.Bin006]